VNDHDVKFKLEFWMLLTKEGMKLKFSIVFHLQTDGQIESVSMILNQYFCNYIASDHKDWGDHIGLAEFCYNSTKHSTTKTNPFELALGVEAKQPMDLAIPRTRRTHHEGDKEAEEMAKECEKRKAHASSF
jgi:hypothetical protein